MTARALKITTCFAALIATAVIGASPAMAVRQSSRTTTHPLLVDVSAGSPGMSSQPSNLPPIDHSSALVLHTTTPVSHAAGFDWTDAGIGAVTATLVSIVLFGVLLDLRRRRMPAAA